MHTVYDTVVVAIKLIIYFKADGLVTEVHAISAKYHSSIHRGTLDLTSLLLNLGCKVCSC